MSLYQELEAAQVKLNELREKLRACPHQWGEPVRGTETAHEYVYKNRRYGVDFWPEIGGTREVQVPIWSRTCAKCGWTQTTKQTTTVPSDPIIKPVFK